MPGYCNTCKKQVEFTVDSATGKQACQTCGTVLSVPSVSQLNPGTVINGFLVESRLGQGGMGVVYKAKQLNLERYVALKVLSDELSRDSEFVDRFFKEARSAASLSHSNIVQVYDAGSTLDGIYYFAMELIEGETLDTRITREGVLPPKDAIDIAVKIASALDYAWERQKLCHGDIKPENIILNSSGGAKLADLGLAKSLHDEKATKEGLMATPLYAPPEVVAGDVHRIDCRSDMYSFGATLYHMLSGSPPFTGDDPDAVMKRHLNEKPVPLAHHNKDLNPLLSNIVDHMLAKNPENRPSSWKEVCKSLEKIHDVERKVFHKVAPGPSARPGQPQAHEEASHDPLMKIVAALVATVLLLAVLAIAVFLFLDYKKKNGGGTQKPPAAAVDNVNDEWQRIKTEINRCDPELGIELIQNFVRKYPTKVPADADKLLQGLKQKLVSLQEEKKAHEKKFLDLQKEVTDLLGILSSTDFSKEQKPKLEEISRRIEAALDFITKNKEFQLSKESKDTLNQGFLKISDILIKQKLEDEKKIREEEARKEKERIEQEKRKLAEEEKLRQDRLSMNHLVDGYYLAISNFEAYYLKKKDAAYLKELLDAWLEENKKGVIPENLLSKCEFIKATVVPSEPGLYSIFEKNEGALRGKPLPGNIKDTSGYDVDRVAERSFKLMTSMGKGKFGKNISWDQLNNDIILQILNQRILNPDSGVKLGKQEQSIILTFHLLNGMHAQFSEMLKNSGTVYTAQEKKKWESVSEDFQKAPDERKAIDLWREFTSLMKEGKVQEASQYLIDINNSCKNTEFYKRYSEEIARQLSNLQSYLPDLQAIAFLENAGRDIKANNFTGALSKVMTAYARCGGMKNLRQSIKDQIQGMQTQCLNSLSTSTNIKNISDNRIPFYYWEVESPGDSWIYEQVVKNSGKVNQDKLLASMEIGSCLDIGNWSQAHQISNSGRNLGIDKLIAPRGNLAFWSPSFIFAQGLVYMNYNDWESQSSALSGLQAMCEHFKQNPMGPMDTLTSNLAIEYALMLHMPVKASDIAAGYQYNMQRPDREVRIALLQILLNLQLKQDEFPKSVKKYSEQFKQYQEAVNDFNWCRMAMWMLDESRTLDPKRIQFLKDSKCIAPDITARILSSAVAKAHASGPGFGSDREIYPFLEARVSGNLVSGELWRNISILKIARSHSAAEMLRQTGEILNDGRFCSIGFYPKLCMIRSGLEVATGRTTPQEASKRLKFLLDSSGVASDSDKKSVEVILSDKPVELVSKFMSENRTASAFWCGILGIMTHKKDGPKVSAIYKAIEENIQLLTWEERLLLKVVSD
ncbi:MAG TPA: hypothetical protein DCZ94_04505 [Lentisphaeria bacterium]|nr:MAG: hypothetical protein A2X48_20265 [Lentisphaerae bacterium GWF2_49_21]HBC86198.1 hypothetical protein [Lentisphaeria bacterium]